MASLGFTGLLLCVMITVSPAGENQGASESLFPTIRPLRKNYIGVTPVENWDKILDPVLQAVKVKLSGRGDDDARRAERIRQLVKKLSGTVSFAAYVSYVDDTELVLDMQLTNPQTIHGLPVTIEVVDTFEPRATQAVKIATLKDQSGIPTLRRGSRVLVTGRIETRSTSSSVIIVVVTPTSIVPLDDLYHPPQDPLDRDNLVNTAMALTHLAHEVSLAGKGGNELRAKPLADLMLCMNRSMAGRQVSWLGRIRRITTDRILLEDRAIEGERLFKDIDLDFTYQVRVLFGEVREVSERQSVPIDLVSPATALDLSAEDTVRLRGRIKAVEPGLHEIIIRVTVTELAKTNDNDFGDLHRPAGQ